ncbi:MAG: LuxR C-terminal-related transcriptional regulator [Cyanobacteria bacterium CAN_BIN43]|nr:LuxR C-terminal-related transcriptional regulator [Cyanobacteria bacterium CAN_BIN43]
MVYLTAPFSSIASATKPRHLRVVRPARVQSVQPSFSQVQLLQAVIEGFIDGILIVTPKGEVLEANSRARELCQHLSPPGQNLPSPIWQVCEALIESQKLFPGQRIMPEAEGIIGDVNLRIRVRWMNQNLEDQENSCQEFSCLIVTLEDRQQTLHNLAIADTQKYDLTTREAEIWQMRLQGQSYQAIASELYITQNTVKKHVKNILAKRRDNDEA